MITNLPDWILPNIKPSFNDLESATAVEMVYKLYGKNKELIDDYIKFVEDIKNEIKSFKESTNQDKECFENKITKICKDYIKTIDKKIKCQDTKVDDAIKYMKDNLINTIRELNENDELDDMIISAISNVDRKLSLEQKEYEQNLNLKQESYEKDLDSRVRSLASGSPKVANSISGMTDTSKVYVNTSDGNWYYYNGTNWVVGGVYQATQIAQNSVSPSMTTFLEKVGILPQGPYIQGKVLNFTSGDEMNFPSGCYCNDFYELLDSKIVGIPNIKSLYKKIGNFIIYFYDENKIYLSQISMMNRIITVPENAKYYKIGNTELNFVVLPQNIPQAIYLKDYKYLKNNYLSDRHVKNVIDDNILNYQYNIKKLLIPEFGYNVSPDETQFVKENNIIVNNDEILFDVTLNPHEGTLFKGMFFKANFNIGDIVTFEFENLPSEFTQVLFFGIGEDTMYPDINNKNFGSYNIINQKASFTISENIYNKLTETNLILFSLRFDPIEIETNYSFKIKISINENPYYFVDYIKEVNETIKSVEGIEALKEKVEEMNAVKTKKLIVLGDSITALGTTDRGWLKYFNEIIPINIIANTAVNSAVIQDNNSTVLDGNPLQSNQTNNTLANQVQKIINNNYEKPDFIIIAIGTNSGISTTEDLIYNSYYDNEGNKVLLENVDRKTIAGACRYAIEKLQELYPNIPIFWCSPIQANNNTRNVRNVITWNKNLHLICEYASIITVDSNLCGIKGIYETSGENGKGLIDGLHPNANGAKLLGAYNANVIKQYLN